MTANQHPQTAAILFAEREMKKAERRYEEARSLAGDTLRPAHERAEYRMTANFWLNVAHNLAEQRVILMRQPRTWHLVELNGHVAIICTVSQDEIDAAKRDGVKFLTEQIFIDIEAARAWKA